MMPNAWFYKLRDMSKIRSHNPSHQSIKKNMQISAPNLRKSIYSTSADSGYVRMDTKLCLSPMNPKFGDSRFPHAETPRKSAKRRAKRRTVYAPSPRKIAPSEAEMSAEFCHVGPTSPVRTNFSESALSGEEDSCTCDIIIDVDDASYDATARTDDSSLAEFNVISERGLPPIRTKQAAAVDDVAVKSPARVSGGRKSFSGGVKIRGNGRRVGRKRPGGRRRRNGAFFAESFAIVKASLDPERDFKESMMEMIVENDLREARDLEELLACYLSLNSSNYHDLIIKAFEQIWAQLNL